MVFLSQQQLLGEIIPDVFISKITLETSKGTPVSGENPHIDRSLTPREVLDPLTGKLLQPFVPPAITAKISPTQRPEKLNVTLDLLLKEKLGNGVVGTWFGNQNFSKYLKLKVIQSTKKVLTKEASDQKVLLNILDGSDKVFPSALRQEKLQFVSDKLNLPASQNIHHILNDAFQSKVLSVKDDIQGGGDVGNQNIETGLDGVSIVSFPFRVSFEMNDQNPDHLAYFAFTYIDLDRLAKDYNMVLGNTFVLDPIGKVISELVFSDGEIVDETFVYLTSDGAVWTGRILIVDDENIIGISGNDQVKLKKVLLGNAKIQDFRHFKTLERLVLDFSIIQNEILNVKLLNPRNDIFNLHVPENMFSDFHLTRDEENRCRFFFSINYRKMLEQNGMFGKLYKRLNTRNVALRDSSILSMKVFRRRVKGSPEIGSPVDITQMFDSNQTDETVVLSGEKKFQQFSNVNNKKGSLREVKNIFTNINDHGNLRHFSGVDKTIPDATDGYFIYGVEMEIEDPSYDFLFNKVKELRFAYNRLKRYHDEATSFITTIPVVSLVNPYIDIPNVKTKGLSDVFIGNYDPYLNRFTQQFITSQMKKYNLDGATPWGDAVRVYIDSLKLFAEDLTLPFDKFEKSLFFFTHPATGNPEGIFQVLKLIEALDSNISKILGLGPIAVASYTGDPSNSPSKQGLNKNVLTQNVRVGKPKPAIKTFKVNKLFSNSFNASVEKSVGYDFLGIAKEDDLSGLKMITGEEYSTRVNRETDHYFIQPNGKNPDIDMKFKGQVYTKNDNLDNTSFSYLTPARVKLGSKFDILRIGHSPSPILHPEEMIHLDLSIKMYNNKTASPKSKNNETNMATEDRTQNIFSQTMNFFSKLNIEPVLSHNNKKTSLVDILGLQKERKGKQIDLVVVDNTNCKTGNNIDVSVNIQNVNPTPLLLALLDKTKRDKSVTGNKPITFTTRNINEDTLSISSFDLSHKDNVINKIIQTHDLHKSNAFFQGATHHTTLSEALRHLPNQVKSLFLSKTTPDIVRKNWFAENRDPVKSQEGQTEFRLSYQMINTVQVFGGYKVSTDGEFLLKSPSWEPLTLSIYNQSIGEAILCRLFPYENRSVAIVRKKELELPFFNEYFLLTPKQKVLLHDKFVDNVPKLDQAFENKAHTAARTEYISNNIVNNTETFDKRTMLDKLL